MGIYVETRISGSIDELWEKTQRPELHQRWDLRFTQIRYLPRPDPTQPQRFLYQTRIGFGISIKGEGEAVSTHINDQQRTSALKFWSDDPKSLIKTGSGYWKYEQRADSVRFLTGYDYETRFGVAGRLIDSLIFRPLMGWATAWSFDRLRLWLENGIDPGVSLSYSIIHATARLALTAVWLYQGLVPKLLFLNSDEQAMMAATGLAAEVVPSAVRLFGLLEVLFALFLIVTWTRRWPLLINLPLMVLATLGIVFTSPSYLAAAFNPVTLNLAVIVLALIAYWSGAILPSARRCLRKREES